MRIAILGAGNVGSGLAAASIAAGHDVVLTAADPIRAKEVADQTGAVAASSNTEAAVGADLVVLAVPHAAVGAVASELSDALGDTVLVDATNPLNDTFDDLVISGTSAAADLQQRLPGVAVVKAFNTIFASRHADPVESGAPLDAFIAGDDDGAKSRVSEYAASLGYRVIDAGGLRMARTLEEMAFLNISLNAGNGWAWQSGWKLVGPTGAAA